MRCPRLACPPARRRHHGFTLTEVLVVIGIIIVLIGIVTVGITYVGKSTKASATKVTLNNLQSMITEMETATGLSKQPSQMYVANSLTAAGTALDFWHDANPNDGATPPEGDPVPAPVSGTPATGMVTPDFEENRFNSDAVGNTQIALQVLVSIPRNRTAFTQFPAEQLMGTLPTHPPGFTPPPSKFQLKQSDSSKPAATLDPPIPLDAWGNPILFVPAGGLGGVKLEGNASSEYTITSQGPIEDLTTGPAVSYTVVPAGVRPFWASAGPDGSFVTGDDNIYSFEN